MKAAKQTPLEITKTLRNGNTVTVTIAENGSVVVTGSAKVNICIPFARRGGDMKAFARSPDARVEVEVATKLPRGPVVVKIDDGKPIRVPLTYRGNESREM